MLACEGSYHRSNPGASLQNNHLHCEIQQTILVLEMDTKERNEESRMY